MKYRSLPDTLLLHLSVLFALAMVSLSSCGSDDLTPVKDAAFYAEGWRVKDSTGYPHRKAMVNAVLADTRWAGKPKDSVISLLGPPDSFEEGNLRYDYAHSEFLGGFGTKIDAVVFELGVDSCVKRVRENGGGFD